MNKDEDVELLEPSSTSTTENIEASNVAVSQVPSDMGVNTENILISVVSNSQEGIVKDSSMGSPFASKPNVVGTTVNSPRISPDATFAATSHSMKQQVAPKSVLKQSTVQEKVPVSDTNTLESSSSQNVNSKSPKPVFLIIGFILLLGTIVVLPYSKDFFDKLFSKDVVPVIDDIKTGELVCTMESEDLGNSFEYTETYSFDNSKVDTLEHVILVQGDADYLRERNAQCQILKQSANSVSGVTIDCDLSGEEMVETQFFNLARFDSTSITPAFTEAGGVSPNAKHGDSYKEIKRVMEMSRYECKVR